MMEVEANVHGSDVTAHATGRKRFFAISRVSSHDLTYGVVLLLIWLAVSLPRLHGPIDLRWDASTYYVLGTSLAEGKGYRLLNEPGEIKAVQYPPLLPLIIAAQQRLMKTSDYFEVGSRLRVLFFVLSGIYLLAVYALARQLLGPAQAFFVGAVTGFSFSSFFYPSETLYADLPFALVSIAFLLCLRKTDRPALQLAGGILAASAYLLRTAGVALLAAWVIESLIRRRWIESGIRAAVAAVPVFAWQIYVWQVSGSAEYRRPTYSYQRAPYYYSNVTYRENSSLIDPFRPELGRIKSGDVLHRVTRNIMALPLGLGESSWFSTSLLQYPLAKLHNRLPIPLPIGWGQLVAGVLRFCLVAMGLLCLVGAVVVATGRDWFLSLYFTVSVAVVALTPWQSQFWRYLSPLASITLIFLAIAIRTISHSFAHRRVAWQTPAIWLRRGFFPAMLAVQIMIAEPFLRHLLPVSYYNAAGQERVLPLLTYEPHWHALDRAFEWLRQNADANAVIATSVPQLAYLRSGRKTVLPPFDPDPEKASRLLDEVPVSYLVLDELHLPPISDNYAAPIVAHRPESWRLAYAVPDGGARVFERVR